MKCADKVQKHVREQDVGAYQGLYSDSLFKTLQDSQKRHSLVKISRSDFDNDLHGEFLQEFAENNLSIFRIIRIFLDFELSIFWHNLNLFHYRLS